MDFVSKSFDFKPGERCIVIGEVGVNHNCDEGILFKLIDEGIGAGLDIIKLQRFNSALEISEHAALADYQAKAGMQESQLKMAQELELPDELLVKAFEYCKERGVGFLCTAFEHESVDFMIEKMGVKTVKVASPELSNKPLLDYMARKFDGLLISSGASYLEEVETALGWIKEAGGGRNEIALMHCTSQYPASLDQANLKAIVTMREAFGVPVGYSDHTQGHSAAVVSTGLGGAMIEKHYTLDKTLPGPDHQASVDIKELAALVKAVRAASDIRDQETGMAAIEALAHLVDDVDMARSSLGDGVKQPAAEEEETRPKIRKSLYIHAANIDAGTVITPDMVESHIIGVKRPYDELAYGPADFDALIGRKLNVAKAHDEPILRSDVDGS